VLSRGGVLDLDLDAPAVLLAAVASHGGVFDRCFCEPSLDDWTSFPSFSTIILKVAEGEVGVDGRHTLARGVGAMEVAVECMTDDNTE
jgi:ligand-binding sensor domain-containing protein